MSKKSKVKKDRVEKSARFCFDSPPEQWNLSPNNDLSFFALNSNPLLPMDNLMSKEKLAQMYTDLGTKMKLMGNASEALLYYMQATTSYPQYSPAYYNAGVIYSEMQRYKEALECYQAAITYNPFYVEAYCNIGVIYKNLGRLEEAIDYYQRALKVNPNFIIARNNLSIALTDYGTKRKNEGYIKEGIRFYKQALFYNFQYADAYYNLGVAYGEQMKVEKAVFNYQLAIHFNPLCCQAFNNLGVIYKDQDNLEKAIQCYQAALTINPHFSQTLNNLGVIFTLQGRMDEAYEKIEGAIRENPTYSEAYNNLGVLYRDEGLIDTAIECYEKCLAICPTSRNASQNRLLAFNYSIIATPEKIYQAHEEWGEFFSSLLGKFIRPNIPIDREPSRKLRIGYISGDFFTHSVSYFIDAILTNHDRDSFHVICYSNVVKEDNKTQRFKSLASTWKSVYGLSAHQVATMIAEDRIDILVELSGHSAANRLDVMALKPAPIQVTYIGYPNTTGLKQIDYRFADEITDPLDTKQQYTEKLIRLPKCFLCYSPPLDACGPVVPLPCLTNGYITFGSFNNLAKINSEVLDLWAEILKRVPNSRFVIKCKPFASESVQRKFKEQFVSRGISASRIDLLSLLPSLHDHLQSYRLMDLSLDTFPYAGTTTTCEALWMGVPVIPLKGVVHAQNVGLSLLKNIGEPVDSLIANSKEEYISLAIQLANDTKRLKTIRETLRTKMKQSYLCRGKEFTKNIESVYRNIWKKHLSNSTDQSPS